MGELDKTMTMEDEAVLAGDNGVAVGVGGDMEDGILMGAADRLETILLQKEEIVQTLLSLKAEILSGNNEKNYLVCKSLVVQRDTKLVMYLRLHTLH